MDKLNKIDGSWRGMYRYDPHDNMPEQEPVPFILVLKQGWFGRFSGTVNDDAAQGMPGTGTIEGYLSFPHIEFTKRMPVCYVLAPDGGHISLREFLTIRGHACDRDVPHALIHYQGEFQDARHAEGTWAIRAGHIPLPNGMCVPIQREQTGTWTIEADAS